MEVRRNDRSTQKRSIPQIQLLNRINYPREQTVRKQLLKHTSNAIFDQNSSQNEKCLEHPGTNANEIGFDKKKRVWVSGA
jgi:hypothetical protein